MIFVGISVFCQALLRFDKFNNFIRISFSKSKTCIQTLSFSYYNTGMIFEIAEYFFK